MSLFTNIFNSLRSVLSRKTTGAVIALVISFIYFSKGLAQQKPMIKLSYFLAALSQNVITEVVVSGTKIFFRSAGNEIWYQTNSSLLGKDRLYKLLSQRPNVIFSSIEVDEKTKQNLIGLAIIGASYFMGYKLINMMTKDQGGESLKKNSHFNHKIH